MPLGRSRCPGLRWGRFLLPDLPLGSRLLHPGGGTQGDGDPPHKDLTVPLPGLPGRWPQADGSRTSRPQVRSPGRTGLMPRTGVEGAPGGHQGPGPCGPRGCYRAAAGVSPGRRVLSSPPARSMQPLLCVALRSASARPAAELRVPDCPGASTALQSACCTRVPPRPACMRPTSET